MKFHVPQNQLISGQCSVWASFLLCLESPTGSARGLSPESKHRECSGLGTETPGGLSAVHRPIRNPNQTDSPNFRSNFFAILGGKGVLKILSSPRPKGSQKTGGRQKGTPNKRTEAFVTRLTELNLDLLEEIAKSLPDLVPEKRVHALITMLPYCYSKANADVEVAQIHSHHTEMSDEDLDAKIEQYTAYLGH
jgi:hypothetical protein